MPKLLIVLPTEVRATPKPWIAGLALLVNKEPNPIIAMPALWIPAATLLALSKPVSRLLFAALPYPLLIRACCLAASCAAASSLALAIYLAFILPCALESNFSYPLVCSAAIFMALDVKILSASALTWAFKPVKNLWAALSGLICCNNLPGSIIAL